MIVLYNPRDEQLGEHLSSTLTEYGEWLYLGSSYTSYLTASYLLGRGKCLNDSKRLASIVEATADPYLQLVGKLGSRYGDASWWAGTLSEKNQHISPLFLNICHVFLGLDLAADTRLQSAEHDVLFIFEDTTVFTTVSEELSLRGIEHRVIPSQNVLGGPDGLDRTSDLSKPPAGKPSKIRAVIRRSPFVLKHAAKCLLARAFFPRLPKRKRGATTMIIEWVDQRSFKGAKYVGLNFGDLATSLQDSGRDVMIVPNLLSGISFTNALSAYRSAAVNIFPRERFLRVTDAIRILSFWNIRTRPKFKDLVILGIRVDSLFAKAYDEDSCTDRPLSALLNSILPERLRQHAIKVGAVIYPFENHVWERPLLLGMRDHQSRAKCFGVQCSSVFSTLLNFHITKQELAVMPMPDRLFTASSAYRDLLVSYGHDAESTEVLGAIRYAYLFNKDAAVSDDGSIEISLDPAPDLPTADLNIAVALSIDVNLSLELLENVIRSLGGTGHRVFIKCHPNTSMTVLQSFRNTGLPSNFVPTELSIPELLATVDCLVYCDTTSAVEAMLEGLPVIHVAPLLKLDMDPLEMATKGHFIVRSDTETSDAVGKIADLSLSEQTRLRTESKQSVSPLFERPNNDLLISLTEKS